MGAYNAPPRLPSEMGEDNHARLHPVGASITWITELQYQLCKHGAATAG